jgi:tetratricopeptide (TPR) repeat protein
MMGARQPFTNQLDHDERTRRWNSRLEAIQARLQKGGAERAVAAYRKAIARAGSDWALRYIFGQLLRQLGRNDEAAEQFEAVVEILPHFVPAYNHLGKVKLAVGRPARAITHFRAALKLAPDYREAHLGLAAALGAHGEVEEALGICAARMKDESTRTEATFLAGKILMREGRLAEARERLEEARAARPEDADIHAELGDLAVKEKDMDAAIRHYEEALRLRPGWRELTAHLAKMRRARDNKPR